MVKINVNRHFFCEAQLQKYNLNYSSPWEIYLHISVRKSETESDNLTTSNTNFDNQKGNIKLVVYLLHVYHVFLMLFHTKNTFKNQ